MSTTGKDEKWESCWNCEGIGKEVILIEGGKRKLITCFACNGSKGWMLEPSENPDNYNEAIFYRMLEAENTTTANAPDGAWQAILEDTARFWAEENNVDMAHEDGNDAFQAYLSWCRQKEEEGHVLHPWQEGYKDDLHN